MVIEGEVEAVASFAHEEGGFAAGAVFEFEGAESFEFRGVVFEFFAAFFALGPGGGADFEEMDGVFAGDRVILRVLKECRCVIVDIAHRGEQCCIC